LAEFGIEIGGGLGPWKGKAWRVGLMGVASCEANVLLFLAAIEKCLLDQGGKVPAGAGVAAAIGAYRG
jgi:alanine-glyoxylate transaminase / serine-glyoxylate transaminase / serine-pyruvate transaminase